MAVKYPPIKHDEAPGTVKAVRPAEDETTREKLAKKMARADELLDQFEQLHAGFEKRLKEDAS